MQDCLMWVKMRGYTLTVIVTSLVLILAVIIIADNWSYRFFGRSADLLDTRITSIEQNFYLPAISFILIPFILALVSYGYRYSIKFQSTIWKISNAVFTCTMAVGILMGLYMISESILNIRNFDVGVSILGLLLIATVSIGRNAAYQNTAHIHDAEKRQKRRLDNEKSQSENTAEHSRTKARLMISLKPFFSGPFETTPDNMRLADLRISDHQWNAIFQSIRTEFGKDIQLDVFKRENLTITRILDSLTAEQR